MNVLVALKLVGGLAALVVGAELLVRGASSVARRLGMSELVIGLTVVAFGTSAPELAANLTAALGGSTALALANASGSNLFNIGIIIGLCALLRPLQTAEQVIRREIPWVLAATAACLGLAIWGARVGRGDAALLLVVFGASLVLSLRSSRAKRAEESSASSDNLITAIVFVVLGLAVLVGGAHFAVDGAVAVGRALGWSESLIGLTIVAAGTSLPELATSAVATLRGQIDIAVGNVVGSNLFNISFIVGTTALVAPVEAPGIAQVDIAASGILAVVLLPLAVTGRRITRLEGGVLVVAYVAYTAARFILA